MPTFNEFALPEEIYKSLEKMKYTEATPIQELAIPAALAGKDIIASAQTGTGKTAAFSIPLITKLINSQSDRALVLAPTRELAAQIVQVLRQLTHNCKNINIALLIGGVAMNPQRKALRDRPRLIVATPGRLADHMGENSKVLANIKFLVLDEADRMLDLGFAPVLRRIREKLDTDRQTMLFSATYPSDIAELAKEWLTDPERIIIGSVTKPIERIEQSTLEVTSSGKNDSLLSELTKREGSVLVFARTKRRTDKLAQFLQDRGHMVCSLHGGRSQRQRDDALKGFRAGKFRVLVATDIAARGIDVPHIEHVINYDLPFVAEDYLHRIGRTARAGKSGQALCLIAPEERSLWRSIEKLMASKNGIASTDRPQHSFKPERRSEGEGRGGRRFGGNGRGRNNGSRGRFDNRGGQGSGRDFRRSREQGEGESSSGFRGNGGGRFKRNSGERDNSSRGFGERSGNARPNRGSSERGNFSRSFDERGDGNRPRRNSGERDNSSRGFGERSGNARPSRGSSERGNFSRSFDERGNGNRPRRNSGERDNFSRGLSERSGSERPRRSFKRDGEPRMFTR